MTLSIVDASVALKWFVPEVHSEASRRLLANPSGLVVPPFFWSEFTNIAAKQIRRNALSLAEAQDILASARRLLETSGTDSDLLPGAFDLANETRRSVYDCFYLALALRLGGEMVTADRRFYDGIAESRYRHAVRWVEDVEPLA